MEVTAAICRRVCEAREVRSEKGVETLEMERVLSRLNIVRLSWISITSCMLLFRLSINVHASGI